MNNWHVWAMVVGLVICVAIVAYKTLIIFMGLATDVQILVGTVLAAVLGGTVLFGRKFFHRPSRRSAARE